MAPSSRFSSARKTCGSCLPPQKAMTHSGLPFCSKAPTHWRAALAGSELRLCPMRAMGLSSKATGIASRADALVWCLATLYYHLGCGLHRPFGRRAVYPLPHRVDGVAVDADLVVEMRPGREAGAPDIGND